MIKKFLLTGFGVILLALSSCAAGSSSDKTANQNDSPVPASSQASADSPAPVSGRAPASSANSSSALSKVASNISFREGTGKGGRVLLSASDLTGFYTGDDTFDHSYKMIIFKLTESAEKPFAEETAELAKSEGTISLWAGEERLNSSTLSDAIIGDTFMLSHLEEDDLNSICKKLESTD